MLTHQLLKTAAAALSAAGIEDSALEAELLLRHCLKLSRSGLILAHQQPVPPAQERQLAELLRRRRLREPLQHILGSCAFWSLDFLVTADVLIPRPETEFLLEHVLTTLAQARQQPQDALDLCAGSGVIAVVLARELPAAQIVAADCSCTALAVARSNSCRHGMAGRIQLLCADLLSAFAPRPLFDLIVSNPPYIRAGDLPGLQPEVRDWEPRLALSGGSAGMDCIAPICAQAASFLRPCGWLFLEIGADLGDAAAQALHAAGQYEQIRIIPDWAGRPRVAQARKKG